MHEWLSTHFTVRVPEVYTNQENIAFSHGKAFHMVSTLTKVQSETLLTESLPSFHRETENLLSKAKKSHFIYKSGRAGI